MSCFRILAIATLCTVGVDRAQSAAAQAPRPINSYIVQVAEGVEPAQVGRAIAQRTGGGLGHVYTRALRGFSIQLPPGMMPGISMEPMVYSHHPTIPSRRPPGSRGALRAGRQRRPGGWSRQRNHVGAR